MIYILGFFIYVAQTTNLALAMSCDCKPEYCKPVGFCKGKFTSFLINSTISFISDIFCETLGVIFQLQPTQIYIGLGEQLTLRSSIWCLKRV